MIEKVKSVIISDIRNNIKELELLPYSDVEAIIFRNPYSIRLTKNGMGIMKMFYDSYEFKYDSNIELSAKHVLNLSVKMKFPYYIGNSVLVLFSSEDAFWLKLHANDLKCWLDKEETEV